ncbi:MAG: class I SAM-dependent methyltransferase [Peptoniphilus sp.]|nr:class I SAM-dependent methyltransferase [Peptoniphilus sp.]
MNTVKFNYREIVDEVIENMKLKDCFCLDATCGNGKDSLNILSHMEGGFLYCCDLQEQAVQNTHTLLKSRGFTNFKIIKKSHDEIFEHMEHKFALIIYNLGYLPGSDKNIITKADTTVKSISQALHKLQDEGVIIVVSYLGHPGSAEEREAVDTYLQNLDQKKYKVEKRQFYNQKNDPPIVYLIGGRK